MRFSLFAAVAALAGSAVAVDHLVVVGNGSLTFEPSELTAAEGDTVTFKFWPKSHSVVQSTFASPCEPMSNGFWSGFVPSTKGAANTTYTINITNATQPLWYYCSRATHCQEGMVGVINAPKSGKNTLKAYAAAAKSAKNNTSPVTTAGVGGKLSNAGTASSTTPGTGAASMLSASNGAIFSVAIGMAASFLV